MDQPSASRRRCSDVSSDSNMLSETTVSTTAPLTNRFKQLAPPSRCSDSNNNVRRKTNIESIPNELLCEILIRLPADGFHLDIARLVCRRWCLLIRSRAFITWCHSITADVPRKTNIESLSDKWLMYILLRLPANFLHHSMRSVCRRWCQLIHSDDFIKKQIQLSTYGLLISPLSKLHQSSLYVTATESGQISISEFSSIRNRKILATGNCLAVELGHVYGGGGLHVINPATKQSFCLPSVSVGYRNVYFKEYCGIAYSAASMKYKVTVPYYDSSLQSICLDIVTVGVDKSWRHVEIPPLLERFRSLFCSSPSSSEGGFLHWGKERDCLTLNVETEAFTMSEAPIPCDQRCDEYSYYYQSTGRYLTLLVGHRRKLLWEVWEMRPAESGEWRKAVLPNIDLEPQKYCSLQQQVGNPDYIRLHPMGWVKYPEVFAFCFSGLQKRFILYYLETHEIRTILLDCACKDYKAFAHKASLVWLSK